MAPVQSKMCGHRATRSIGETSRNLSSHLLGEQLVSVSESVLTSLRSPRSGDASSADSESDYGGAFTHCHTRTEEPTEDNRSFSTETHGRAGYHKVSPSMPVASLRAESGIDDKETTVNVTKAGHIQTPFDIAVNQDDDVFGRPLVTPALNQGENHSNHSSHDHGLTRAIQTFSITDKERSLNNEQKTVQSLENEGPTIRDLSQLVLGPLNRRQIRRIHRTKPQRIDAQRIYSASACVFIANLPENQDDRSLEVGVTKHFNQFGVVFAKIRRDQNGMPYAFVQFTDDKDANDACENGRGAMILGRPIRTEMAKADVQYIVSQKSESETSIQLHEVRSFMETFGELKKCELVHAQMRETLRLPESVLVSYRLYDPHRNLPAAAEQDTKFSVEIFEVNKRQSPDGRMNANERFLAQYDTDRRSIYVGGLSNNVTEGAIQEAMREVGEVLKVSVYRKENLQTFRSISFAFVEFDRPDTPDRAIQRFNGQELLGTTIRVERKTTKHSLRENMSGRPGRRCQPRETPEWMKRRRGQSPRTPVPRADPSISSDSVNSPLQLTQPAQAVPAASTDNMAPPQLPVLPVMSHYPHFAYGTPQVAQSNGMSLTPYGYYAPYYSMPAPETYAMYPISYASSGQASSYTSTPYSFEPYRPYPEGPPPPGYASSDGL